jgi:hypothetical protein
MIAGFSKNSSMKEVIFPSDSHVREIDGFCECTSFNRIDIPILVKIITHPAFSKVHTASRSDFCIGQGSERNWWILLNADHCVGLIFMHLLRLSLTLSFQDANHFKKHWFDLTVISEHFLDLTTNLKLTRNSSPNSRTVTFVRCCSMSRR